MGDCSESGCDDGQTEDVPGRTGPESRYYHGQLVYFKNNKARAVRFSTLEAICKALDCQPGRHFGVCP